MIGPATLALRLVDEHYGSLDQVAFAVADALNKELLALDALGIDLIQLDEPEVHFRYSQLNGFAVEAIDRAFAGVKTRKAVHMCYGYSKNIAEKRSTPVYADALSLLAQTSADAISLEYAQPGHSPDLLEQRRRQDGDPRRAQPRHRGAGRDGGVDRRARLEPPSTSSDRTASSSHPTAACGSSRATPASASSRRWRPPPRSFASSTPEEHTMALVRAHNISVSLDGYMAGPDQSLDNPLGVGGTALHEWAFASRTFRLTHVPGLDRRGHDGPRRRPHRRAPTWASARR